MPRKLRLLKLQRWLMLTSYNRITDVMTQLLVKGMSVSGGQRQRIAIARAILKNAPIMLMDEATSALDNESERAVNETLQNLKGRMTIIMIAHRTSNNTDGRQGY